MAEPPRPEVVQALVAAWSGDPAALDDLTAVTAAERQAANALVAAMTALDTHPPHRQTEAERFLAAHGLAGASPADLARAHPDAWLTYQRILLAVDELD